MTEIKLSDLNSLLGELSYPATKEEVVNEIGGVRLLLADGDVGLGEVAGELGSDRFESRDDLENEIYSYLPREAVGEPGQSEGDA